MNNNIDEKRLEEIRAREQIATQGKWLVESDDKNIMEGIVMVEVWENDFPIEMVIADCPQQKDANFIAHAHDDIPYLLELVDSLSKELTTLSSIAKDVVKIFYEWRDNDSIDEWSGVERLASAISYEKRGK